VFFLEKMMLKLGFYNQWVQLIMACISSVWYNMQFNSYETKCLLLQEGFAKAIHSPLTCFSYAQRLYCVFSIMLRVLVR
jgi:hypothetical protein